MVPDPLRLQPPTLRRRLAAFMNHPATDLVVIGLIATSVALLVWEASTDPRTALHARLFSINWGLTAVFCVELGLRFLAERHKMRFFRRYWLDILAVLPILRPFRFLRFLRLLRVFRLGMLLHRRSTAISAAFRRGLGEQVLLVGLILVIVLASAMVLTITETRTEQRLAAATPIAAAEPAPAADAGGGDGPFGDFWQSLRWSVLSLIAGEPVGEMPRTLYGFLVTLVIMLGGLTLFATFTGVIAAIVVNRLRGGLEQFEMDVEDLSDHTIVCGFNRACPLIVEELQTDAGLRRRGIVLVTETDVHAEFEGAGVDMSRLYFLRGDWTHPDNLARAGATRAAIAVVLADRTRERSDQDCDARTLLAALTLERIHPGIFTCAELLNSQNEANLRLAGIDEVIARDTFTGRMIAAGARNLGIAGVLKELLTSKRGNQFHKVEVPPAWVGRTVAEVRRELQDRHEAILVALETPVAGRHGGLTAVNPPADTALAADQLLVLIAEHPPRLGAAAARCARSAPENDRPPPPAGPAPA
ncbi:MAG: ion transporter [Planctomycetes bacterium]|nr:ion transporter [Planctomycetota bacterium]